MDGLNKSVPFTNNDEKLTTSVSAFSEETNKKQKNKAFFLNNIILDISQFVYKIDYRNSFKLKQYISRSIILIIFLSSPLIAKGKKYSDEKNLYYVDGKYFRVIFEGGIYDEAIRVVNNLDHFFPYIGSNLGYLKISKTNVLLKNRNAMTNAAVETYPRRMCIYYHYPQLRDINGNIDWIDLVCLHESRHVIQNKFYYNKGANKIVNTFIGTRFPTFETPNWFSEGDAVYMETILTHGGRGRSPSFSMLIRSNILENRSFSYDRALNATFNKVFENEYDMGYHLICHIRRKYGDDVIYRILQRVTEFPHFIFPFDLVVYSETKKFMSDIYNDMISELKILWNEQIKNLRVTESQIIKQNKKEFTDYIYPQVTEDGGIIALKKSNSCLNTFIYFKNGKEKELLNVPYINHGNIFSFSKNKITWSSAQFYPIWKTDSLCSVIKVFDLKTKKITQITKKSVYKAPCLSPTSNKIATIRTSFKGKHSLEILNTSTGKLIKKFDNPNNSFLITPTWSEDERYIYYIKAKKQKNALIKLEIETGKEEFIIPYTKELIERPKVFKDHIFFNSPYNGINNIYAININNKNIYQITSKKYGSFNPSISRDNKFIIFNDFQRIGMTIAKMKLDPGFWIPIEEVKDRRVYYFNKNNKEELKQFKESINSEELNLYKNEEMPLDNIPIKYYKKRKLSKFRNLIDLNSIPIWPIDLESSGFKDPQFTFKFKSKNINEDSVLEGSFSKFYKENKKTIAINYMYEGIIPHFGLNFKIEDKKDKLKTNLEQKKIQGEFMLTPKLVVPFMIRHNNGFIQSISLGWDTEIKYNYKSMHGKIYSYTPFKFKCALFKEKANKDVASRWGQKFALSLRQYFDGYGKNRNHEIFSLLHLYFPGLLKHHSFQILTVGRIRKLSNEEHGINFDYAFQKLAEIHDGGASEEPTYLYFTRLSKKLINFHLMYEFPLCYPEMALGPLFYISSINLKLVTSHYIDFVNEDPKGIHKPYFDSIGIWLLFPDIKALRLPMRMKFTMGFGVMLKKDFAEEKGINKFEFAYSFKSELFERL